jgi:hypothetical protein
MSGPVRGFFEQFERSFRMPPEAQEAAFALSMPVLQAFKYLKSIEPILRLVEIGECFIEMRIVLGDLQPTLWSARLRVRRSGLAAVGVCYGDGAAEKSVPISKSTRRTARLR